MNLIYAVIEVDSSRQVTLKWMYWNFSQAHAYAKKLYKEHLKYYKSEWTYDNVSNTRFEALTQASWWWQVFYTGWYINELEFEFNKPCEIQLN